MAKNPYMSAWLSAANKVANTARGQAMAAGKAEARRSQKDATSAWFDLWTPPGSKSKGRSAGNRKRTTSSSKARAKRR
ncbi:MAG: hypothetical protein H0V07_00375 [Propionibacteriales bacterium]|nr:hypothetical protein [Propionibacteriales bacterium]